MDRRRRHRAYSFAIVGFASALWLAGPALSPAVTSAGAQPDRADGIDVDVTAGVRGWYDPGDHVVVTATITSDATINGRLDVALGFANTTISRDVQVAAGTSKVIQVVAPTAFDQAELAVQLIVDGDVVDDSKVSLKSSATVELVGILPALATRIGDVPEQVELVSDLGRAQLDPITDELFGLGPTALDAYDTIIGVGGDLTSLDDRGRASLLSWMNHGGRLVLDDDGGTAALPESWRPIVPARYALTGRGEVRIVDGLASAGKFADLIEPSTSSRNEQSGGFFGPTESGGSLQADLAERAGVRLPSLTPILIGLVVYVIVIGPILYVVLRMRRRLALGWVLVPAIAVVAAGVVLVVADGFRDSGKPAAVAFVDAFPGGSEEELAMLTFTRSGGTSRIALPPDWQIGVSADGFRNFEIAHQFVTSSQSSSFRTRLEPGQVTDASFVGLGKPVGLELDAVTTERQVTGTVTNTSPTALVDVAVFSSGDAVLIGRLEAGESAPFELDGQPVAQNFGLAQNVWSQPDRGFGVDAASDKAEFAIWGLASERLALYPTGLVRAAGWTDDLASQANLGADINTRTVVTTTASVVPGAGPLTSGAVRTVQVRAPFDQFGGGNGDSAIRYLLSPTTVPQTLVIDAAVGMPSVEFWNGRAWQKVNVVRRLAVVPPAAVREGVVLMRIESDPNFAFDPNQVLLLRGATERDGVA